LDVHSFPTRRSSDLLTGEYAAERSMMTKQLEASCVQ
jgi:hypothetical protein